MESISPVVSRDCKRECPPATWFSRAGKKAARSRSLGWMACLELLVGFVAAAAAGAEPAQALADRIDQRLARTFQRRKGIPAQSASDSEWIRHVDLDLVGRIPRIDEVRDFLADKRTDRRTRLVERLLANPAYAPHWSQTLRAFRVPQASANLRLQYLAVSLESWLRQRIRAGRKGGRFMRDADNLLEDMADNWGSPDPAGVWFLFCDGRVRLFRDTTPRKLVAAIVSPNGGESADLENRESVWEVCS